MKYYRGGGEDRHKRLKSLIKETSAITAAVTIAKKKYHQKQSMYMVDVHALGVEMHVQVV